MLFYFDEAGDFNPPKANEHKCAVSVGLIVPETEELSVRHAFEVFCRGLKPAEKTARGEPKGSLLQLSSRDRFFDVLNAFPDVKIVPATIDLAESAKFLNNHAPHGMRVRFYEHAERCIHLTMQEQVRLLGRQFGNISFQQMLWMLTLTSCVKRTIEHMVIFLSGQEFWSCYERMSFTVDKVGTAAGSRVEQLLDFFLFSWIAAWSLQEPISFIKEIHTQDHPFVKKYDTPGGVDLTKLMRGNIRYESSETCWGLQMADIVANTLYGVVHDLNNSSGMLPFWKRIMKNCHCGPAIGPGLIVADNAEAGESKPPLNLPKYSIFSRIMEESQH